MDRVDEARRLREEYEAALDEAEAKRSDYHRAVLKLNRSGMPLREIAEALGISHQRVHQIVTGERTPRSKRKLAMGGAALSIVLVLGLTTGYLRLAHLPPFAAATARIAKVPNVTDLTRQQATMIVTALGFGQPRLLAVPSAEVLAGFVVTQAPSGDSWTPLSTPITLTYSTGPGPSPERQGFVLARALLIPITRTGAYSWASALAPVSGLPRSFTQGTRFIGDVTADPPDPRVSPYFVAGGTGMTVTFNIVRFSRPAWLALWLEVSKGR
jgi:transcriptional regulator with XRE-family HTH domain